MQIRTYKGLKGGLDFTKYSYGESGKIAKNCFGIITYRSDIINISLNHKQTTLCNILGM